MGKGDKKSKKGKIWRGSYGNSRSKKGIKVRLKRIASIKREVSGSEVKSSAKKAKKKETA